MRRTVCLFLVIIMIAGFPIFSYADTDGVSFDAELTELFNSALMESPTEWGESGLYRALLAVILVFDAQNVDPNIPDEYSECIADGDVYIGRFGIGKYSTYALTYRGSDSTLVIQYDPSKTEATYYKYNSRLSRSSIKESYEENANKYWEIDAEDVADAIEMLSQLFDSIS